MRTRTQRFISALLAVAMMFVMLPVGAVTAFADDAVTGIGPDSDLCINSAGQPYKKGDDSQNLSNTSCSGNGWSYDGTRLTLTDGLFDFSGFGTVTVPLTLHSKNGYNAPYTPVVLAGGTFSYHDNYPGTNTDPGVELSGMNAYITGGTYNCKVAQLSNPSTTCAIYGGVFKGEYFGSYVQVYGGIYAPADPEYSRPFKFNGGIYQLEPNKFSSAKWYKVSIGDGQTHITHLKTIVALPAELIAKYPSLGATCTTEVNVSNWDSACIGVGGDSISTITTSGPIENINGEDTYNEKRVSGTELSFSQTGNDSVFKLNSHIVLNQTFKKITIPSDVTVMVRNADDAPFQEVKPSVDETTGQKYVEVEPANDIQLTVTPVKKYLKYTWKSNGTTATGYVGGNNNESYTFSVSKDETITYTSELIKKVTYIPDDVTVSLAESEENKPFTENDIAVTVDTEGKRYVVAPVTAKLTLKVSAPQKNYSYTWKNSADADEKTETGISYTFAVANNDNVTVKLTAEKTADDPISATPVAAAYYVEHYKEQANGNYERMDADTELLYGKIGEKVTANPKAYKGYAEDTENADRVASGVVVKPEVDPDTKELNILTLKLYYKMTRSPLILDGAEIISVKADGKEIDLGQIKNADGSYNIPEGAIVTIRPANKDALADSGSVFDRWDITGGTLYQPAASEDDTPQTVDTKKEELTFVMPADADKVTIKLMTRDATIDEGPDLLGAAVITGTAVVGGAILAYGAHEIGTELYLIYLLPSGAAIPQNRIQLAKLMWEDAGKPAPAVQAAYSDIAAADTEAQQAAQWAVENQLLALPDEDKPGEFAPYTAVSHVTSIRAWKKAQEMKTSQPR